MAPDFPTMPMLTTVPVVRLRGRGGFTLVEMLVSTAIMLIVILVLLQVIAGMTNIWHNTSGQISSFQSARASFNTITRTLSRATLKSYVDYVDTNGQIITNASTLNAVSGFAQVGGFARASDLWFMCGPTTSFNNVAGTPIPTPSLYPGDATFFCAPLGIASSANYKYLQRSINFLGFYVSYNQLGGGNGTGALPPWLQTSLGFVAQAPWRYRLMQYLEYTDKTGIYSLTSQTAATDSGAFSDGVFPIRRALTGASIKYGDVSSTLGQNVVLAENITLLIFRPRIEPADEKTLASSFTGVTYNTTTANSIISPNYGYDSRAWWVDGPTFNGTTQGASRVVSTAYGNHMRNQLPPIIDVAMVAVDPNSIVHFGTTSVLPPAALAVPTTLFGLSGVCTPGASPASASMDTDLATYGLQLSKNHIHYRIFRTSVQMEGAGWVDN
jgi:uncharacterized protein (TIGR02599 family)